MSHHHDHHAHAANSRHGLAYLAPSLFGGGKAGAHRLDRRRFVADLGRGTFAMAILGVGAVACSSADTATTNATAGTSPDPTAVPAPETPVAAVPVDSEPATEVPAAPVANELQWSQVSLGFVSAYVLVRGNTAAVVDTGTGGITDIGNGLATFGLNFDDVAHVLLTHAHGDHVGGLPDVLTNAPTAVAYAGAADVPNIIGAGEITAVGDGDDVFGLQIFDTPGHTPGSISMLDPEIGLLIAGDALNTNGDGTEITAANPNFTSDMSSADDSVRKLAGLGADTLVVGHGNPVVSGAGPLLTDLAATLG